MQAVKTLAAIEQALQADQGAKFRELLGQLMPLAGDAYNPRKEDWRNHLGASLIGRDCGRELWYSFRWATAKMFDGRMVRLFNRGHLEEPRFVAMLAMIGCEVWQVTAEGGQFRIAGHKGQFGGSLDGVARGIPEMPDEPVLTEFKTHGEKSFIKLVAEGVLKAKWEHFVQMQIYMGKQSLRWALYMAVNKNTDELYAELVEFDPAAYERYLARSVMIIDATSPPPKINQSPGWHKCKFCDHAGVCHGAALPPRTCRSCMYAVPVDNGAWHCTEPAATTTHSGPVALSPAGQRAGCSRYAIIPTFKSKV